MEDYTAGLLRCKGGAEAATEIETALIENAGRAFGACLLILEEAAVRGLVRQIDATWDLAPGLSRLVGFLGGERQALVALGLERRERDALDLALAIRNAQEQDGEHTPEAGGDNGDRP